MTMMSDDEDDEEDDDDDEDEEDEEGGVRNGMTLSCSGLPFPSCQASFCICSKVSDRYHPVRFTSLTRVTHLNACCRLAHNGGHIQRASLALAQIPLST